PLLRFETLIWTQLNGRWGVENCFSLSTHQRLTTTTKDAGNGADAHTSCRIRAIQSCSQTRVDMYETSDILSELCEISADSAVKSFFLTRKIKRFLTAKGAENKN